MWEYLSNISTEVWVIVGLVVLSVAVPVCLYFYERKVIKAGCCGHPWVSYDMDSQGGIGLKCQKCHKGTWVSWCRKGFITTSIRTHHPAR